MPKRGKGNRCKPIITEDPNGSGAIDTLQVDPEGDFLHLNVLYDTLAPLLLIRLQVYLSFNNGAYRLFYTIYPENVTDAVPVAQVYQVGDTYSYYYEERSQSGELQARSNVVTVVI